MRRAGAVVLLLLARVVGADTGASYTVAPAGDDVSATASFTSFSNDALTLTFALARRDIEQSTAGYGYAPEERRQLHEACVAAQCSQAEFDARLERFYREHGLATSRSGAGPWRLWVDVPGVVRRDQPRVRSAASALSRLAAARGYGANQTFDAAVAMVQTAVRYKNVPQRDAGRETLGFYPPARTLELGWGDCDTKSALLAALMTSFSGVRMIGVHVPGHYLVGIARVPHPGDAYLEYQSQPFVLVEAAGPGWLPPGTISDNTQSAIGAMDGVRIDPFF
jgi:hypothetical protein